MERNVLLANRIKELCKEKNMTYQMVAEKGCMPVERVYRLYNGMVSNPGVFTMINLCDGLGITLDEFFSTEEFKEFEG